ncbi:DNA gyrase subunit A [Patescibacteria group bacterium]|nr:DNA gyrase subunit A [Patescibacteria group bacterium]MBU1472443.1 DNA gyrase subunit A [Patescibacteria group bacterium]MBU2460258.1 DNA gyrase subunit A [Patescibacteria group bacterium]MBU2543936.1 DNA gyrase subunit A [Patescibacteria group bacterium]
MNIGKVQPSEIVKEMQKSYLDYAMSVIVSRALPDVRDGLKPVHRRILFAMHQVGLTHTSRYSKSAKIVGEVLGKYHPHGDAPVYEALVRMAQEFSMRYRLVDGQGNFGSIDGDPPAAMRYTECRMAAIAGEMLLDIEKDTVEFTPNFDSTIKEPVYLPAKLPNLLLMGSEGIAVGMATKIPPHNLCEIVDAVMYMIGKIKIEHVIDRQSNPTTPDTPQFNIRFDVGLDDLLQFVQGPDFPTGGSIYDINEIKAAYATGKGKIVMRGKAEIEDIGQGKNAIAITELPYQVNKATLVSKIADLVKDKKIEGISDLRDESDRRGIRVVVELKRDAQPNRILNNLYKHTDLQCTFPVNTVALVDNTPQTLGLKNILEEYLKHRHLVIHRRSEYELREARAREHILEGLKIAVDHIDEVISIIKKSKDAEEAKIKLIKRFGLTDIQATAILDMQLRRLAALERQKIEDEIAMIRETISYLENLLKHPEKIFKVIKEELIKLKDKYGDPRKTRVYKSRVGEFSDEQLIPNERTIITMSQSGYIKRVARGTFKTQGRGGKGVIGMTTKEEDTIDMIFGAQTHDNMLFFTDLGRVYQVRVWDIPEASRQSKGQAVVNLIDIEQEEKVTSVLTYSLKRAEQKEQGVEYILMATKNGTVKKSKLSQYENIRRNGLVAIKLEKDDELAWAKITSGKDDVLLVSHEGKSIRFSESEVRPTGRDTMGVRGILLKGADYVVITDIINHEAKKGDFLTIMEKGIGKKTPVSGFPKQKRGGQGVKVAEVKDKTGKVVVSQLVPPDCEGVILTSTKGQVVKLPISSVPSLGRATSGVILMRFTDKSDTIAAATCLTK